MPRPILSVGSFRLVFSLLLCLALLTIPIPGLAGVGTNPTSGNPLDYSGTGDWYGSADPDQLTNESGATVNGDIYANHNSAGGSSGGGNTISNQAGGQVDESIYGSYNEGVGSSGGGNNISNSGAVVDNIYGSRNTGANSSGSGNTITNNSYNVDGVIFGSSNEGEGSSGGGNTIINSGSGYPLGIIGSCNEGLGSSGGGNTITNIGSARVWGVIIGSDNFDEGTSGGFNTINNSGSAEDAITGSSNWGDNSSGGGNIINNSGDVAAGIYGSENAGLNASGGDNTITNSGTVSGDLCGSFNLANNSSGGGNTIINSGTVDANLVGSLNWGSGDSGGGNNTITNSGTVTGNLYGSWNWGAGNSGGGNNINNSGTVEGNIYGTYSALPGAVTTDNTITNSGTVGGSILAGDGDDTVIMESGAENVTGSIDGGAGTDKLVYGGGTWALGNAKLINFESFSIDATANLTLDGNWDLPGDTAQVSGGSLTVNDALNAGGLNINSGTATINGDATLSGDVANAGTLDVSSGGALSAANLDNSGTAAISGRANINGGVTNSGGLTVGEGGAIVVDSLDNSGTAAISGRANINGGVSNSGGLTVGEGGTLVVDSLENSGTAYVSGTANISGTATNSGTLGVGGTMTTGSLANIRRTSITGALNAGRLDNSGTAYVSGTATINGDATLSGDVANAGTLDVSSGGALSAANLNNSGRADINGRANINGGVTNSGGLTVGEGGTLVVDSLDNSGTAYVSGTANINGTTTNSGTLGVGGTMTTGSLANIGRTSITGALNAGRLDNSGTAYVSGTANISGTTTNSGTLSVGGTMTTGSLSNTGYAAISGIAEISGDTGNSGRMTVNGTLTTARLTNSGTLGGSGTINGVIVNQGLISPGNSIGTLHVGGAATFEPGSTLVAELDSTGLCDQLDASGPVTINGGTISTAVSKALYADGHAWTIISADQGVTGQFEAVDHQLKSEVLSFGQKNTGNALSLVISRKSYGAFASGGAADAGRGLDKIVPLASGDMESLLTSMDYDMTADQISQIVNALNPEMYTAFCAASLKAARLFDRAMVQRLTELGQRRAYSLAGGRDGSGLVQLAAAEAAPMTEVYQQAPRGWGMWGRAMGMWADQKEKDDYLGRGQTTGGAFIGADYMVSDKLVLGLAVGATRTDLSWSGGNYSGDIDAMHTGLYARAGFGGFYTRATASYARLTNSATRPVSFEGFDAKAKADFDANLYAAGLALGYQVQLGDWLFEPMAGLDYQHLREDGFSENGAGLFSYDIASRDTDSALFSLGLCATRHIQADGWDLLPRLGLSWQHQFGDDRPSLDASFIGYGSAPFSVSGAEFPSDLALIEAGLSLSTRPGLDFFADYSLAVADGYHAQTLTVGLKYSF
ncbi:autotransporter domain-containing protein [Dethiosulfatarculus sandiegensis]|uniref:Autotransporter domain-containing protein n=1 Tax=Dethiosulfatarculus sandiegensis TaxID=1429043 RepID=A0A0D2JBG9_9BACT|nr:autotransporter domain-containing protein [Dethiosulfatarculus sandiegensis]KIX13086.1 hypothetical protein X474_16100 [Dethiosulfatarculus sandiegensis]